MPKNLFAGCFVVAVACSAWAADISPFDTNEAELWQKIINRNKPGSQIRDFIYVVSVPNICLVESTTPRATALANILGYLSVGHTNALHCFNSYGEDNDLIPRLMTEVGLPSTHQLSDKTASLLMEQLEKKRKFMLDEESAAYKDLSPLEGKYGRIKHNDFVVFSGGVHDSFLLEKYLGDAQDVEQLGKKLLKFAASRDCQLKIEIMTSPQTAPLRDFLTLNRPSLLILDARRFVTLVGAFSLRDENYFLVHDPLTSAQQFILNDLRMLCMLEATGELSAAIPSGVHIYHPDSKNKKMAALCITGWVYDEKKIKNILAREVSRQAK